MDPENTIAPAPAPAPAPAAPEVTPVPAPIVEPAQNQQAAPATVVLPEKYDFKLPDGYYDPTIAERFSVLAKDSKLPADAAQRLLDAAVEEVGKHDSMTQTEHNKLLDKWEAEAKADRDFGGTNLDSSIELGKRVLTKFTDERFIKDLANTGFGSHPGMIRLLAQIGKGMKEDDFVNPGSGNDGAVVKDTASKLYDHESSKT